MKILVWICESCAAKCLVRFTGVKTSNGSSRFRSPETFCIWAEGHETDPWKLRKMEEAEIIKHFMDGKVEWRKKND